MNETAELISKLKRKRLHCQSERLIRNVYAFLLKEHEEGAPILLSNSHKRAEAATGTSLSSVKRITKEYKNIARSLNKGTSASFTTPDRTRVVRKIIAKLDGFDRCVIRRIIQEMFAKDKTIPTINMILKKIKEAVKYSGSTTTLKLLLDQLGFRRIRMKNHKYVLMEKFDIRNNRIQYLKNLKRFRNNGRHILYVDENFVLLKPYSKKMHKIGLFRAGSIDGSLSSSLSTWPVSSEDKHLPAHAVFEEWATSKLLPNLPTESVIIFVNGTPRGMHLDDIPGSGSTVSEMKRWLCNNNIPFDENMLKPDLYNLILLAKPKVAISSPWELFERQGHTVLYLPPMHADLNPVELIWSQLKSSHDFRSDATKPENTEAVLAEKFPTVGKNEWQSVMDRVQKNEDEYLEIEKAMDEVIDEIIVSSGGVASDLDDSNFSDSSDSSEHHGDSM